MVSSEELGKFSRPVESDNIAILWKDYDRGKTMPAKEVTACTAHSQPVELTARGCL